MYETIQKVLLFTFTETEIIKNYSQYILNIMYKYCALDK